MSETLNPATAIVFAATERTAMMITPRRYTAFEVSFVWCGHGFHYWNGNLYDGDTITREQALELVDADLTRQMAKAVNEVNRALAEMAVSDAN